MLKHLRYLNIPKLIKIFGDLSIAPVTFLIPQEFLAIFTDSLQHNN